MVIERRQILKCVHCLISFILISRIGKTNNGEIRTVSMAGGPKKNSVMCFFIFRFRCWLSKLNISENLKSILRSVHFTFSNFTSLKKNY